MSNIAIGIGLSGKEKADLRGLEYLVGAEKDMAGQREAKKKAEDAAKQKLIDDVMKNTAFKQQFGNAFFQKEFERDAAARMAKIIEPMMSGQTDYTNIAVLAHNEISALERANRERKIEDESMTNMNKAFLAKPSEVFMSDPRTINGKTYNSPQQFLNSNADNPNAAQMMSDNWGGANWFMVANPSPELGRTSILFNPEMALTMDPIEEGTKFLKSGGVFNVPGAERFMKEGRTTVKYQGLLPDENSIFRTNAHLFSDPRFGNTALLSAYTEARQQKPDLNYSEWLSGINLEETVNTYADSVMNTLKNYEGDKMQVSDTRPAPKEPSQSDSAKNADKIIAGGGFNMDGTVFELPFTGVFQQERVVSIPKGATFITGPNSKPETVGTSNDIKATPIRIEWNPKRPMEGNIIYQSKFDPTGKELSKTKASDEFMAESTQESSTYTYRVPVTKATINNIASLGSTNTETLVSKIVEKSSGGPVSEIEKWLENALGVSPSGMPGPGQAPTGQQNPTSGVIGQTAKKETSSGAITADEFNKKWATLKSGQSLVGPDGKTYKKP